MTRQGMHSLSLSWRTRNWSLLWSLDHLWHILKFLLWLLVTYSHSPTFHSPSTVTNTAGSGIYCKQNGDEVCFQNNLTAHQTTQSWNGLFSGLQPTTCGNSPHVSIFILLCSRHLTFLLLNTQTRLIPQYVCPCHSFYLVHFPISDPYCPFL